MPLPLLAAPVLALAGRTAATQLLKEGFDKLTGGDKKEAPEGKQPEKKDCSF